MTDTIALPNDTGADITLFQPQDTKILQAKSDAMITLAAKLQDWPLLERAVDAKIEDQLAFVEWWTENVSVCGAWGRSEQDVRSDILLRSRSRHRDFKQKVGRDGYEGMRHSSRTS